MRPSCWRPVPPSPTATRTARSCSPHCARAAIDAPSGASGTTHRSTGRRRQPCCARRGTTRCAATSSSTGRAAVPRLHNPDDVVRWNSDKIYLHELELAGVPITPTTVVAAGRSVRRASADARVRRQAVRRRRVARCRPLRTVGRDAAAEHVAALHRGGRTALVQPYLAEVDDARARRALVYLDGGSAMPIRKGPMLPAGTAHDIARDVGALRRRRTSRARDAVARPSSRSATPRRRRSCSERFGRLCSTPASTCCPAPAGPGGGRGRAHRAVAVPRPSRTAPPTGSPLPSSARASRRRSLSRRRAPSGCARCAG